jgi:hypothetical protein
MDVKEKTRIYSLALLFVEKWKKVFFFPPFAVIYQLYALYKALERIGLIVTSLGIIE